MRLNSTQSRKLPMDDFDDIPVARRDTPSGSRRVSRQPLRSSYRFFWITGLAAGIIALLAGAIASFLLSTTRQATTAAPSPLSSIEPLTSESLASASQDDFEPTQASVGADTGSAVGTGSAVEGQSKKDAEAILGHYPFQEVSADRLTAIAPGIQLADEAADAYNRMQDAASADGVRLVPVSGFRSKADQQYLFFNVKGERGQTAEQRAKVSAPPGHSEHHTGYAVDIGDARDRSTDLSEYFETTEAFAWLEQNAPYYSFELSFPRGNKQGVNYEPWHWRYVGDQASLELFHRDR